MCGWNMISHVHGANGRSFLLRKRRLQGNLLETYTILRGFGAIDPRESFSFRELKELRVHLLTLVRARVRTIFKQTFFAIVVVNLMKRLSEVIVVPAIYCFDSRLVKAWCEHFPGLFDPVLPFLVSL